MSDTIFYLLIVVAIPSIVIFGAVYYFTNKWTEVQREKNKLSALNQSKSNQTGKSNTTDLAKHFFPLQVEAYQRMVLFLERIAPNNMIMRLNNPGLPARAFQEKLLSNVRQEYEHNLAQQIFISPQAWEMVKNSKEDVLKIINMAATKMEDTALANDLSKSVFEITAQLKDQPTDAAIQKLKAELNKIVHA
jgi:hypothetical protein